MLNGRVKDHQGAGVVGATVRLGETEATTDQMGAFQFVAAPPGPVQASKMAYAASEAAWDGSADRFEITLEPFIVKGIRIHGPTAGTEGWFEDLLDMIDGTVINTLVFDTKDEKGRVVLRDRGPGRPGHRGHGLRLRRRGPPGAGQGKGYYTITRIVTFQDPFWATANPEHAARNTATGGVWTTSTGLAWADPTDREAWEYPLELALEACRLGFDEIQFDYVRFPSDGDVSVLGYDIPVDEQTRAETVAAFLTEARDRLHPEGCVVSADVFAIILSAPNDQGIGQTVERSRPPSTR